MEVTTDSTTLSVQGPSLTKTNSSFRPNGQEYTITFNGEIYNYRQLRSRLRALGYSFATESDTEVLLCAFIEWKEDCVNFLNGDFAFAIYDHHRETVFLARDRVGVKPLYYALTTQGSLVFGSETRAVLSYPEVSRQLNPLGLIDYLSSSLFLTNGWTASDRTCFAAVTQLPPGHYAYFDANGLRIKQYWNIPLGERSAESAETLAEEMCEKVTRAVNLRIPAETEKLLPSNIVWREKMPLPENLHHRTQSLFYEDLKNKVTTARPEVWDILSKPHFEGALLRCQKTPVERSSLKEIFLCSTLIRFVQSYV